jgi:hypothetical protein
MTRPPGNLAPQDASSIQASERGVREPDLIIAIRGHLSENQVYEAVQQKARGLIGIPTRAENCFSFDGHRKGLFMAFGLFFGMKREYSRANEFPLHDRH